MGRNGAFAPDGALPHTGWQRRRIRYAARRKRCRVRSCNFADVIGRDRKIGGYGATGDAENVAMCWHVSSRGMGVPSSCAWCSTRACFFAARTCRLPCITLQCAGASSRGMSVPPMLCMVQCASVSSRRRACLPPCNTLQYAGMFLCTARACRQVVHDAMLGRVSSHGVDVPSKLCMVQYADALLLAAWTRRPPLNTLQCAGVSPTA